MAILRVVPAEPRDGKGPHRCQGTKLFVGDQELTGVTRVELVAQVNEVWRAKVECMVELPPEIVCDAVIKGQTRWQRLKRRVMRHMKWLVTARTFAVACLLVGMIGLIYASGGWVSVVGGIGGAFIIVYMIGLAVSDDWAWFMEMVRELKP